MWTVNRRRARMIALGIGVLWPHGASAHAFAERYDLPVPLGLYLTGAGATVALSFVVVAMFLGRADARRGYPRLNLLRSGVGRWLAHPLVLGTLRAASAAIFAVLIAAGFVGTDDPFKNISPTLVWVIWWVGMAYVSAILGNLWSAISPWAVLYDWASRIARLIRGGREPGASLPYPEWLGAWPAAILFFGFAWIENVWHGRELPQNLAWLIIAYSAVTWAGMIAFGREEWLRRGEAFAVLFGLIARFAPSEIRVAGRGACGGCTARACRSAPAGDCVNCVDCFRRAPMAAREFNLRPPAVGLLTTTPLPWATAIFVLIMLATVTFDGFTETPFWIALLDSFLSIRALDAVLLDIHALTGDVMGTFLSAAMLIFPLLFLATYGLCCWLMARAGGNSPRPSTSEMARGFILTLVPIAIAYHLAHYLSYLLIAGQLVIPLSSDPFGLGWDLFGTRTYLIDVAIVGTEFVWVLSIVSIVAAHVIAVYLAHRTALAVLPSPTAARRSQYPMLVLMVGYTMTSLWILAQPVVEYRG